MFLNSCRSDIALSGGGKREQFSQVERIARFRPLGKGWSDDHGLVVILKPGDE